MVDYSSADAIIQSYLKDYGLESLSGWATQTLANNPNLDSNQLNLMLSEQPAFKERFPAMDALRKAGKAITVNQYMAYEQTVQQTLQSWGIPKGMYDTRADIADLLVKDVSPAEVNSRVQMAAQAAYTAPQEVRDQLKNMYGISGGDLIGYWLDPDKAAPILQKQYAAATVAGAAERQNIALGVSEAERLAAIGITGAQADQGFGQVAKAASLMAGTGETVSQNELTNAVFGTDAAAAAKVSRVTASRAAAFASGGNAAETSTGVSGLGSAAPA